MQTKDLRSLRMPRTMNLNGLLLNRLVGTAVVDLVGDDLPEAIKRWKQNSRRDFTTFENASGSSMARMKTSNS